MSTEQEAIGLEKAFLQQEHHGEFQGFAIPEKNFYHMPNAFTNVCAEIESLAEVKILLYLFRHTWGYQEYGVYKAITTDEFMHGRKKADGTRMDKGTGLSNRSVIDGLAKAVAHGFLDVKTDTTDLARVQKSYSIKMLTLVSCEESSQHEEYTRSYEESSQLRVYSSQLRVKSSQRSEKDTLERNLKKDTSRKKKHVIPISASSHSEHAAAVNRVSFEQVTEEEMALIQAHRQGVLKANLPRSENLGGSAIEQASKQAKSVLQTDEQSGGVREVPTEVNPRPSLEALPLAEVSSATVGTTVPMPLVCPAKVTTTEEVVQTWEYVRQARYSPRERIVQLRAATTLLGLELPTSLTPEVLETLYQTYFDAFWKQKYGELHVSHLVETEKSSGQVRVLRWINRLRFQSVPAGSSSAEVRGANRPVAPEVFKPTMDFANYHQEEARDMVQEFIDGKITEDDLKKGYPPAMLILVKRHAAARLAEHAAIAVNGGNQ